MSALRSFAFVHFKLEHQADVAVAKVDGFRLDKKHTLFFKRFACTSLDEYRARSQAELLLRSAERSGERAARLSFIEAATLRSADAGMRHDRSMARYAHLRTTELWRSACESQMSNSRIHPRYTLQR